MITAILDTNVIVQAAMGSPRSASLHALQAYDAGRYRLAFSPETIDELLEVLQVPSIRARHGWSDEQIVRFVLSLLHLADILASHLKVPAALPRDQTDVKLLSLVETSGAAYLVTNDRRHLLRLKRFGQARILTPYQFLREI
jgi:putative PIN family toxin of toxin-antitoxin system